MLPVAVINPVVLMLPPVTLATALIYPAPLILPVSTLPATLIVAPWYPTALTLPDANTLL